MLSFSVLRAGFRAGDVSFITGFVVCFVSGFVFEAGCADDDDEAGCANDDDESGCDKNGIRS